MSTGQSAYPPPVYSAYGQQPMGRYSTAQPPDFGLAQQPAVHFEAANQLPPGFDSKGSVSLAALASVPAEPHEPGVMRLPDEGLPDLTPDEEAHMASFKPVFPDPTVPVSAADVAELECLVEVQKRQNQCLLEEIWHMKQKIVDVRREKKLIHKRIRRHAKGGDGDDDDDDEEDGDDDDDDVDETTPKKRKRGSAVRGPGSRGGRRKRGSSTASTPATGSTGRKRGGGRGRGTRGGRGRSRAAATAAGRGVNVTPTNAELGQ
eukprot:Clim_evm46s214 gene=Clim_evmTU46s214